MVDFNYNRDWEDWDKILTLQIECKHCGNIFTFDVMEDDFFSWKNGDNLIQDALPYLTAGQRELLISETCDYCWDKMFEGDE